MLGLKKQLSVAILMLRVFRMRLPRTLGPLFITWDGNSQDAILEAKQRIASVRKLTEELLSEATETIVGFGLTTQIDALHTEILVQWMCSPPPTSATRQKEI
jgi:hypothetical protein